ncbi:MAG: hypothetical protein QNJ46_05930 [Leptolyngbyaceae cyanobacterium MO_188.B28]|nr:hypothetical protein [Leptolyngbyaceae cyanobacterium MO_188.B28]
MRIVYAAFDGTLFNSQAGCEKYEKEYKPPIKTDYTRELLIRICEQAIVPMNKWKNRDSWSAQRGVGKAWVLLNAGVDFEVCVTEDGEGCSTNEKTIWLEFDGIKGFSAFENGWSEEEDFTETETIYLPTPESLERANGGDWY